MNERYEKARAIAEAAANRMEGSPSYQSGHRATVRATIPLDRASEPSPSGRQRADEVGTPDPSSNPPPSPLTQD